MAETFVQMAARMGFTTSEAANAEPWPPESVTSYAERHGARADPLGYAHLPDVQIASAVRMLMRDDLDHESVVCAARDRICALHVEKQALLDACRLALPKGLALNNRNISDEQIVPLTATMGELRRIAAAVAKAEGRADA